MKEIHRYQMSDGRSPYLEWFQSLKDDAVRNRVRERLARVRLGNFGDSDAVGQGVFEFRFHFGPGYRIYCGLEGSVVVLLLCGGHKGTQKADIRKAQEYWADYRRRTHESK
ncbi:MAG: type II toxin-antitoxin system RelE/ParE family toxin [Elusimicrobia bacterium]|nr:type II toxin-antitoxin system RelE/ParE family toxin [Elusimicrobiota bacterium]